MRNYQIFAPERKLQEDLTEILSQGTITRANNREILPKVILQEKLTEMSP